MVLPEVAVIVSVYVPDSVPVAVEVPLAPPKHAARLIASSAVIAKLCANCGFRRELCAETEIPSAISSSNASGNWTGAGAIGRSRCAVEGPATMAVDAAVVVTVT